MGKDNCRQRCKKRPENIFKNTQDSNSFQETMLLSLFDSKESQPMINPSFSTMKVRKTRLLPTCNQPQANQNGSNEQLKELKKTIETKNQKIETLEKQLRNISKLIESYFQDTKRISLFESLQRREIKNKLRQFKSNYRLIFSNSLEPIQSNRVKEEDSDQDQNIIEEKSSQSKDQLGQNFLNFTQDCPSLRQIKDSSKRNQVITNYQSAILPLRNQQNSKIKIEQTKTAQLNSGSHQELIECQSIHLNQKGRQNIKSKSKKDARDKIDEKEKKDGKDIKVKNDKNNRKFKNDKIELEKLSQIYVKPNFSVHEEAPLKKFNQQKITANYVHRSKFCKSFASQDVEWSQRIPFKKDFGQSCEGILPKFISKEQITQCPLLEKVFVKPIIRIPKPKIQQFPQYQVLNKTYAYGHSFKQFLQLDLNCQRLNFRKIIDLKYFDVSRIQMLSLCSNGIGDEELKVLVLFNWQSLQSLNLWDNLITNAEHLNKLNLNELFELIICWNPLNQESALFLSQQQFPSLCHLSLSFGKGLNEKCIKILMQNYFENYPKIETLKFFQSDEIHLPTKRKLTKMINAQVQYRQWQGDLTQKHFKTNSKVKVFWEKNMNNYQTYFKKFYTQRQPSKRGRKQKKTKRIKKSFKSLEHQKLIKSIEFIKSKSALKASYTKKSQQIQKETTLNDLFECRSEIAKNIEN